MGAHEQHEPTELDISEPNAGGTWYGHGLDEHPTISRKAHWAAVVFASLAALVLILFNLPYLYTDLAGGWISQSSVEFRWFGQLGERRPVQAGFPWTFYVKHIDTHSESMAIWSKGNLYWNILATIALVAAVYFVSRWRYRLASKPQFTTLKQLAFDGCVAGAFLLPTVLVGVSLYKTTEHHHRLMKLAIRDGNCFISCQVPAIIKSKIPRFVTHFFTRVRVVNLHHPSEQLLTSVVHLDTLTGLRVLGGSINSNQLQELRAREFFCLLHLDSMELTSSDVIDIGRLHNLEELSLARTNLDGVMLRSFDNLNRLKVVNLIQTPLRLSELGEPSWKDSVRQLYLPRRANGNEDQLDLEGWPAVHTVGVSDPSVTLSPHPIRLGLNNCQNLRRLIIDRVQKYELVARNLPRFQDISEDIDLLSFMGASIDGLPHQTWFAKVDVQSVPSLRHLGVYANDLESIHILDAPSLRQLSIAEGRYSDSYDEPRIANRLDRTQRIINDISKCNGPPTVDFEGLDFTGVHLDPLTRNHRIRNLSFRDSRISFSQLQQLEGLKDLQSLVAGACLASSADLDWLLVKFPKIEVVDLDISDVEELTLTHRPILTSFHARPLHKVKRVCLKSLPQLDMQIHVSCPINDFEVSNAPQLTGLGLEAPWPSEAKISGLRDLRWFAAGGPYVNDSVLNAVLYCQSLDRLMLAYPSVTKETLKNIGGFLELTSLVLPGADIDDSVTKHYRKIKLLREANFSDTDVDVGTIEWLQGVESMRRLSLNFVPLSHDALNRIAQMEQLNELEVAGVDCPDTVFSTILLDHELEHLNYSDHEISDAKFDMLLRNQSLKLLNLAGCNLDLKRIQGLLESKPELLLYLGDESISESALDQLTDPTHAPRIINELVYQQTKLLLANYGVPHSMTLQVKPSLTRRANDLDRALFGWFDSGCFRRLPSTHDH